MKRFGFYFACTVIIGLILFIGVRYQSYLQNQSPWHFTSLIIFKSLFPIMIGILLRLPKFIIEIKKEQKFSLNWMKLIAIGLPALYITILPIIAFNTPFGEKLLFVYEVLYYNQTTVVTTTGIIFGYTLMDSLTK